MIRIFGVLLVGFSLMGCQTMKDLFTDNPVARKLDLGKEEPARYSDNPQMNVPANRQYQRMTKSRMEEDSELQSSAGSMWTSDGQGSYLFTQNKTRKEGDVLNVKLEGPALKEVQTKVGVIKKLLKQLEEQQAAELARQKMASGTGDATPSKDAGRTPASEAPKDAKEDKDDLTDIQTVSSRLTERMPDGNYRVKGQQSFMIGKREYKVIVTGMIRPEDYNDEGVSSSKLLDGQYDVVSLRRKANNEAPNGNTTL